MRAICYCDMSHISICCHKIGEATYSKTDLTTSDTSKLTSPALSTPGTYTLKATAPVSNSLLPISASFLASRTVLAALMSLAVNSSRSLIEDSFFGGVDDVAFPVAFNDRWRFWANSDRCWGDFFFFLGSYSSISFFPPNPG